MRNQPRASLATPLASVDGETVIYLYGFIGDSWEGTDAASIVERLAEDVGPVTVKINSPGGYVFEGLAIYNLLRAAGRPIRVEIDGLAASIASIIAMAGDEIVMADNALMMIHNPWNFTSGDAAKHRQQADVLDKIRDQMVGIYSARSGQSAETLIPLLDAETWMTSAEALELGLVTVVGTASTAAACDVSSCGFQKPPESPLITVTAGVPVRDWMAAPPATQDRDALILAALHEGADEDTVGKIQASWNAGNSTAQAANSKKKASSMTTPSTTSTPAAVEPVAAVTTDTNVAGAVAQALAADRARASAIRTSGESVGMDAAAIETAVTDGTTVAAFNEQALAFLAARTPSITVLNPGTSPSDTRAHMADAMAARALGRAPKLEQARQFMNYGLRDFVVAGLQQAGIRVDVRDKERVYTEAARAMVTSADVPALFAGGFNRTLEESYGSVETTYDQLGRRRDGGDFKPLTFVDPSHMFNFKQINEGGEITLGSFDAVTRAVQIKTYGEGVILSRQAIYNDDLGYLLDIVRHAGAGTAELKQRLMSTMLAYEIAEIKAGRTSKLFKTGVNGNVIGNALDVAGLSEGRRMLRTRKNAHGAQVSSRAKILLVGPEKETAADQLVAPIAATATGDHNPFAGKLTTLVDDLIQGADWFLFADPNVRPALHYGSLEGRDAPIVNELPVADRDGIRWNVLVDFYVEPTSDLGIIGAIDSLADGPAA